MSNYRISNYEQGLRRLGIEEARTLAKALGTVSPIYLLCLDDEEASELERELLRSFQKADNRGRETIIALARSQCEASDN